MGDEPVTLDEKRASRNRGGSPSLRPWLIVVGLGVVVAAGFVFAQSLGGDDVEGEPPFETAADAATGYVTATNSKDFGLYQRIVTEDAVDFDVNPAADTPAGSEPEKVPERFTALAAQNRTVTLGECSEVGGLAKCEVTVSGGIDSILAGGPIPGELSITVSEEGLIKKADLLIEPSMDFIETADAFWGPLLCREPGGDCGWLGDNYPALAVEWQGIWVPGEQLPERPVEEVIADVVARAEEFVATG